MSYVDTATVCAWITKSPGHTSRSRFAPSTFDFGKNIGGLVSINVAGLVGDLMDPKVGVTFSESSQFISAESSDGQSDGGRGEKVFLSVKDGRGQYKSPKDRIRGGFRYLTLSVDLAHGEEAIQLSKLTVYFTPVPHRNPRDYTGYFHSNDELLNRIWYAGAYTVQLNTIDPSTGESNFGGLTAEGTYTWSLNTTVCESEAACLVVHEARRFHGPYPAVHPCFEQFHWYGCRHKTTEQCHSQAY
ncbi:hypothetical protein BJX66DRAFT_345321 [Aspergillus keveii]|uniref:Uncharacterized protein n=1 Tax=Aspergillus keveii TaxID=714993 RepID=A0ABR4FIG1_9EURO